MRDFAIRETGCIACWQDGIKSEPCEKHHLLTTGMHGNGRRRGEAATVGLCPWHHRGHGLQGDKGPSYAREPVRFRAMYGHDEELLTLQNKLLRRWCEATIGSRPEDFGI